MTRKPSYRFAGYTEPWEQKKLGDVGETYTGLSGKTKEDFGHGEGKFITYVNVFNNPLTDLYGLDSVEIDDKQRRVQYGDVLFTTSSETPEDVGLSSVWLGKEDNVYLNSFCFGYRPKKDIFDLYYLAFVLRSFSVRREFMLLAQGISRFNISKTKVMDMSINVPSLPEQTAIGSFFQNIDQLISLQQRKLEVLKEQKKTYLKLLFPAKGQTKPALRLAGFEDEWKEVKLGEILVERNEQISESEEYQLMSFVQGKGVVPKSDRYDRSFLVKDDKKNYKKTEYGDFIYSSNNLDTGSIGFNKTGKALISPVYSIFYSKTKKESQFIAILSQRKEFINEMIKYRQGVVYGQFRIHESDFLNIKILAPESNEQEFLITFFQDLDKAIGKQEEKVNQLKESKQTLLRKMFIYDTKTVKSSVKIGNWRSLR